MVDKARLKKLLELEKNPPRCYTLHISNYRRPNEL